MIVCEIERRDLVSFPIVNINVEEKKYLDRFSTNPNCHFWIAKERKGVCALLIGELKFSKLEIFRFFSKSQPAPKYLLVSIINFLIEQQNIFGIAVFQNLHPYFSVLEEMGFEHDTDIFMELNIDSWQGLSTSLPSLDFEPLNRKHLSIVHSLRKRNYSGG